MDDSNSDAPILVLCRDLLFGSKISSAAKGANVPIKLLREADKLNQEANSRRLIVDLTQEGFIEAAAQWKQRTGGHVTGFAGHADAETIARAQSAGIDAVMPKGGFAANLTQILK